MRKLFSLFAALTLSAGLWAEASANAESVDLDLSVNNQEVMVQPKLMVAKHLDKAQRAQLHQQAANVARAPRKAVQAEALTITSSEVDDSHVASQGEWDIYLYTTIGGEDVAVCLYGYNETLEGTYDWATNMNEFSCVVDAAFSWSFYEEFTACSYTVTSLGNDQYSCEGSFSIASGDFTFSTTLSYTAPAPKVGDQFVDTTSGLKLEVTAVGDTNTVKVIKNNYIGTSYTVPDTVKYLDVDFAVTEIGESAFERCSSLESVTLPEGLLTIGENAFEECSALQTITIPASVTEIGADAFNSSALQSITIPAGVTEIGGTAFCGCESLQSVTLSEGLLTIGEAAFQSCVSLQSITIPAGVTTIGMAAFAGSGLQTITIPAGVISLGMGAFAECAGLTSVTFLGNACQDAIGELAFYEVGKDAPALLTLPDNWTGTKPDKQGNWYGGKFNLSSTPTALPTLFGDGVKGNKFMHNGQMIIRKDDKTYNTLGAEL